MYKADRLWAKLVVRKNRGTCMGPMCEKAATDPHHVIPRGHKATRHDLDNGMPLCVDCHNWAEGNPKACDEWIEAKFPAIWQYHEDRKNEICHAPDYKARCKGLAAELENEDG